MKAIGPTTLVLVTPAPRGPLGDPLPGGGVEREVKGCAVYPRTSEEAEGRATTLITGLTALLPIEPEGITAAMTVIYRGRKYAVDGEPGWWEYLDGTPAGTQVSLKGGKG